MSNNINQTIDQFLGLNNMLNPSSPTYREGMAYRSYRARLDEKGLWSPQPLLSVISDAPALQACPHATEGYFKALSVDSTNKIVKYGLTTSCDVGTNKKLYSTNGSGKVKNAAGDLANLTRPTITAATTGSSGTSRAANGTYYYMATLYNATYQMEGLPSATVASIEIDHDNSKTYAYLTSGTTATATDTIRFYRSRRTNPADGTYNPTNIFYFLGEITSGTTFTDLLSDEEITNYEYEGRGTIPPDSVDYLVSFNNRMLYFIGNTLYWSSAGRPQEVAQEYSVTIVSGTAVKCKPKLSIGTYGEAKFEITELAGHKVLAAMPLNGRLYIWTSNKMGYLEPTNRYEGYRFRLLREGVGVTSDKVLALSPYGIFGADHQGIWLLTIDGEIIRLSYGVIDFNDNSKDTYFTYTDFNNSFGVWCPHQQEYLWGVSGKILAYQATRGIFVGPYTYAVGGGCSLVTASGAYAYLTGGVSPSPSTADSVVTYLDFWFGQSSPTTIKEELRVETVHSIVPSGNVTIQIYQNGITSTTGATDSGAKTYSTAIGGLSPVGSGRYFFVKLTIPTASPLAVIQYSYKSVGWSKDEGR